MPASLATLPLELHLMIMSYLDPFSLTFLGSTNKYFSTVKFPILPRLHQHTREAARSIYQEHYSELELQFWKRGHDEMFNICYFICLRCLKFRYCPHLDQGRTVARGECGRRDRVAGQRCKRRCDWKGPYDEELRGMVENQGALRLHKDFLSFRQEVLRY